jgi:hypothetical protein
MKQLKSIHGVMFKMNESTCNRLCMIHRKPSLREIITRVFAQYPADLNSKLQIADTKQYPM